MKSVKYLEELKEKQGLKSDRQLAIKLHMGTATISQYMTGKRIMDNEACLAIALELGIDPLKVIMAADIDRAERAGQHSLWEVFSRRTATLASAALITGIVTLFATPTPSEAAPVLKHNDATTLYYVKSHSQETVSIYSACTA
ncbi:Cro/Cl family transcriptional regulator [Collimonas sp.]|jgi:transcriptional regulator with XRE-family HTH domain|uniref:Cro/Cl family transcriptional regulator n=1 Tax=Collimonas sp. TaxID=1963772 RepID=UPI002BB7A9C4|nr:Cro/Cl family transcriptional regulator [Collimonas sp.]HWW06321.1 Cro/Cl family transcriptional regulator [Collimonas sp.]